MSRPIAKGTHGWPLGIPWRRGGKPLSARVRLLILCVVLVVVIALPIVWPGITSRGPVVLAPGVDGTLSP